MTGNDNVSAPCDSRNSCSEKMMPTPKGRNHSAAASKAVGYTKSVWAVEFTDEFGDWWDTLTVEQQTAVL